jgi:hypothetical protein
VVSGSAKLTTPHEMEIAYATQQQVIAALYAIGDPDLANRLERCMTARRERHYGDGWPYWRSGRSRTVPPRCRADACGDPAAAQGDMRATQPEPCHICRMITYDVTATGPLGFQVSVLGSHPRDARLIGDFGSLQEAEAFADRMREIDAGASQVAPVPQHSPRLRWEMDPRTDDLIDRNHVLIAAATKARSDVRATLLKAEQGRVQARITGTVPNLTIAIFHRRKE